CLLISNRFKENSSLKINISFYHIFSLLFSKTRQILSLQAYNNKGREKPLLYGYGNLGYTELI
ncbi:MAG: hypothetical protein J6R96_05955, partial [Spirochaetaceae bacterium]|nr:hypothetical protein [Spirochaetaceae bacterium]